MGLIRPEVFAYGQGIGQSLIQSDPPSTDSPDRAATSVCMQAGAQEERALEAAVRERIHRAVLDAASSVLPPSLAAIWSVPKEAVRRCPTAATAQDLQCHATATAWRRLRVGRPSDEPVIVTTVSEYGLERVAAYSTARELANAVVAAMGEDIRALAADVRVREDGCLLITTQLHLRRQRALGKLHCVECGVFCLGERGLRDHQHIKHTGSYSGALDAVALAKGTIVPYSAAGAELSEMWAARAAEAELQKKALPAGLEAARDGDEDTLRALVAGGWDARGVVDRHGSSALHYAAGSGHLSVCLFLVDELGVPAEQTQPRDGRTALHWAARNGHADVCCWLVGKGLDPDVRTRDGTRPLHWAVWQGHLNVCELLLAARADLHATNSFGCNAIQWAAQTDASDGLLVCRWLVRRGLDVTILNCNGHSALHKAAVKGRRAVCEWLLSDEVGLGAAHLRPDGDGNTPSLMARLEGHAELAEWLSWHERGRPFLGE